MEILKNLWFGFGLVICPIILLFAIFRGGQLLGEILYSSISYEVNRFDITIFILAFCAAFEFSRAIKQAKSKFQ